MNDLKKNKTKVWVNITTIYSWKRPAVGIIRVETEFVKFLLKNKVNAGFYLFDKNTNQYYEIPNKKVENIVNKQFFLKKQNINKTNTIQKFKLEIKKKFKIIYKDLPFPLDKVLFLTTLFFKKIYLKVYLIPKFHLKQNLKHFEKKLVFNKTANFKKNDWIISLGLNWDYLYKDQLGELFIKKKYGSKIAFICYDLIPIFYPHLCVFETANKFSKYFADVAWIADHIFCISKNTLKDLSKYLNIIGSPKPKMSVIRLGDNLPKNYITDNDRISIEINEIVKNNKYVLYVSTIERRKNHEILYRAYRRLLEKKKNLPKLIFVGMKGWGVQDFINDLKYDPIIKNNILVLSNVNDCELDFLLKNCLFTVYPSLYEGWGLPLAESLSYGKFCLSSNSSSLPEIGQNLVEYIDPWDLEGWIKKIDYYISHSKVIEKKSEIIKSEYNIKNWNQMASEILKTIKVSY